MDLSKAIKKFKKSPNNFFSIYLFHGVINKPIKKESVLNYNNKHIHIKKFKTFLKKISKLGKPISMNEVYDIINNKKKDKKKSFAITFDDGFENNISIAAPVLINLQIPFTIYITTSFVDKNAMSWIDKIDYAINETKKKQINIPELNKNFQIKNKNLKINFK